MAFSKPFFALLALTFPLNTPRLASMNVTELARRLRVPPNELLAKLPELGFDIGARAIKVDDRVADQIYKKWLENSRRERLRDQLVRHANQSQAAGVVAPKKDITIPAVLSVRDFAGRLNLPVTRVIQQLMKAGILASQNERIDFTTATIIAEELGFTAHEEVKSTHQEMASIQAEGRMREILEAEDQVALTPRAPVVVVMGHVDHGKTKTLDAIRATHVMEGESGGITQHIGAYQVEKKGSKITFIDTPGHEAFTVMRSRGAKVADIAVLVVAADDGVQPQTKEVIDIIKAAKLPFVVALNKIDKEDADPNRVMGQLAELGVTVEPWGGNVPMAKISAKTGLGIDELLEVILLMTEIEKGKISANPESLAAGTVIEAHVDKGEGPVATVIIQNGTLKRNDWLSIAGAGYGRVRALRDWTGKMANEAPPGMPVKILGLKVAPAVGDVLEVPKDHKALSAVKPKISRDATETFTAVRATPVQGEEVAKKTMLNIVVKTDVLGSLEAILGMLEKLKHDQVGVEVVQKGLGNVSEADIERAATTQPSAVYGFNVMLPTPVEVSARDKNVTVKMCKVIYDLFDDVVARLNALLPQEVTVTNVGRSEVAAIFRTEPGKMIVGARIKEGKALTNCKVRVWRGEDPISEGMVESLQTGKSPVKEASAGQECGITFKGKLKLEVGDILEFYTEESKVQKLEIIR